jgi:hypothetical protein
MMQDPNVNFYETQRAFNNFWENKDIEKGKGWKQFKRWENFMEPRVYPDGIIQTERLYEEYLNLEGIYFLEIQTGDDIINKKIILK